MSNGTPAVLKSLQQKKVQTLGILYKCDRKSSVMQNDFSRIYVFILNKLVHTFMLDSPLKIHILSPQFSQLCNHKTLPFIEMLDLRKL